MPLSFNYVTLLGNAGRDPKKIVTKNGVKALVFSIATNESYFDNNKNEWVKRTDWHQIKVYGDFFINYAERMIKKGTPVFLMGKVRNGDREDSDYKNVYVCVAGKESQLIAIDRQSESLNPSVYKSDYNPSNSSYKKENDKKEETDNVFDSEIPF